MLVVDDLLDVLLLGAFFFGMVFTVLLLVVGAGHLGDAGHFGHGGHLGHGAGHDGGTGAHHHGQETITPWSVLTLMGFLTWFGGVAYLFRHALGVYAIVSLAVGVAAGGLGGYLVFRLLNKIKSAEAGLLDPADYHLPGTIARVTSSIRAGGTGEIVYEQRGVRQVSAARAATGEAIAKGTEVVIREKAGGFALVEPWASFVGDPFADLIEPAEVTTHPPPTEAGATITEGDRERR